MKQLLLFFLMALLGIETQAQPDFFDMPTSAALIDHNKRNYNDHLDLRDKQAVSQVSVMALKKTTNNMKNLVDAIDKRMSSFYIVVADVSTTIHIYQSIDKVLDYQQQAIGLAAKYPWLILWAANTEEVIITDATDLYYFISLIVTSYGDLNKISVANRKQIYTELDHQLTKIVSDAAALVATLKGIDLAEKFKNSPPWQMVNRDKKAVDKIINNFHF